MNARHLLTALTIALLPLTAACETSHATKPARDDHKAAQAAPEPAEDTSEDTPVTPEPDDFYLILKTTQRQCFGSAGCNVTVEPRLTYIGLDDLDPDATYSVTYKIHGDESGPIIETMELTDGGTLTYHPTQVSTATGSQDVTADITDVEDAGA